MGKIFPGTGGGGGIGGNLTAAADKLVSNATAPNFINNAVGRLAAETVVNLFPGLGDGFVNTLQGLANGGDILSTLNSYIERYGREPTIDELIDLLTKNYKGYFDPRIYTRILGDRKINLTTYTDIKNITWSEHARWEVFIKNPDGKDFLPPPFKNFMPVTSIKFSYEEATTKKDINVGGFKYQIVTGRQGFPKVSIEFIDDIGYTINKWLYGLRELTVDNSGSVATLNDYLYKLQVYKLDNFRRIVQFKDLVGYFDFAIVDTFSSGTSGVNKYNLTFNPVRDITLPIIKFR